MDLLLHDVRTLCVQALLGEYCNLFVLGATHFNHTFFRLVIQHFLPSRYTPMSARSCKATVAVTAQLCSLR